MRWFRASCPTQRLQCQGTPPATESPPEIPSCPECGEAEWAVIYGLTLAVSVTSEGIERVVVEDENLGPIQRVICRA